MIELTAMRRLGFLNYASRAVRASRRPVSSAAGELICFIKLIQFFFAATIVRCAFAFVVAVIVDHFMR